MKPTLRRVLLDVMGQFSSPKKRTHFLNGHYVTAQSYPIRHQREIFKQQLSQLAQFLTLTNPADALAELHQCEKPKVCLTFDDGFSDTYEVIAPVLDELNVKAVFFVNPAFFDLTESTAHINISKYLHSSLRKNFLTKAQVLELHQRGHTIGSHTLSHQRLNTDDPELLEREIVDSKSEIEKLVGSSCKLFAYPFGTASDISGEALTLALREYDHVFSSIKGRALFSFDGRVINRRHFEGDWPVNHLKYFLANRDQ